MSDDLLSVDDELVALTAIFGEDIVERTSQHSLILTLPAKTAFPRLDASIVLPSQYPSLAPPSVELQSVLLDEATVTNIVSKLLSLWSPGESVLYAWTEILQEEWQQRAPPEKLPESQTGKDATISDLPDGNSAASKKGSNLTHDQHNEPAIAAKIVHGEPLTEKRSTFQAHLAPVNSVSEVNDVMDYLLQNNKIRSATHNIMAYRIERDIEPKGVFIADADDDGEDSAGGRLLHLLQVVDAKNVVVVVSRWFGGILLGPARFGLINKSAKDLLDSCGYIRNQ